MNGEYGTLGLHPQQTAASQEGAIVFGMYIEGTSPSRHYCAALSRYDFRTYRVHPRWCSGGGIVSEGLAINEWTWRLLLLVMVAL